MSARPTAVLALTPLAERQVEKLLFDPDVPVALLGSAAEADGLLAAVTEQRADAVLLSPGWPGLTAAHCEHLRAAGARLVGLALDARDRQTLESLGVDVVIEPTVSRDELLASVRADAAGPRPGPAQPAVPDVRPERGEGSGSILAVVGSKGAPGASECAASIASLAGRQWRTVLVEVDVLGGGLDVRLGANPGSGSLLGLVRAAAAGGVQQELVERWLTEVAGWPPVLLGPSEPDPALGEPGMIASALHELVAGMFALAVCDVGGFLGDDGQLTPAARVHRETLIAADAVLLVLGSRDIQLRHGLRQLDLLVGTLGVPPERLRIVSNAIGGPGSANRSAITQTITRHLAERGVTVDAWLPWDARGLSQAQRRGLSIAAARRRGGYARASEELLRDLFLPAAAPTPKGRKRRIAAPVAAQRVEDEEVIWQPR